MIADQLISEEAEQLIADLMQALALAGLPTRSERELYDRAVKFLEKTSDEPSDT